MRIIDASGCIVGRLASSVAKGLLNGEQIHVINAEQAVISGTKKMVFTEYVEKRNLNNREAAGELAEEKPELQGKLLAVQLGLQESDRQASEISTSGNVAYNNGARSVLESQRQRGVSAVDEVPDSVLDSPEMEKYFQF